MRMVVGNVTDDMLLSREANAALELFETIQSRFQVRKALFGDEITFNRCDI